MMEFTMWAVYSPTRDKFLLTAGVAGVKGIYATHSPNLFEERTQAVSLAGKGLSFEPGWHIVEFTVSTEAEFCEGCQSPDVTHHDVENVPLCDKCWGEEGKEAHDQARPEHPA